MDKCGIDVPFYINSTGPTFSHSPELLDDFVALRTVDIYYLDRNKLNNMLGFNFNPLDEVEGFVPKLLKSNSPAVVAFQSS